MTRDLLGSYTDHFIGFSPERVDPGRTDPAETIPKVISGIDSKSLDYIHSFYSQVFNTVVPVTSLETAEFCKLYENCFRMVNIAYVQEISDACLAKGVDPHEVIKASSTKPFGFMPFYPGLGIGGHCIPVNPHYLFVNNDLPLLQRATELTMNRPVDKATKFKRIYKSAKRVVVIGAGFKPGQSVTSYSPGLALASQLRKLGIEVVLHDPLIESHNPAVKSFEILCSKKWENAQVISEEFDAIIVAIKQHQINWDILDQVEIPVIYGDRF
jgi:nucleotide sugar dehydrogenase